ncbi:Nucleotidylyl transferase, partial [Conidiobolus coronatus NRRL 28638]
MTSKLKYIPVLKDFVSIKTPQIKFLNSKNTIKSNTTIILDSSFNPPTRAHAALITQSINLIKNKQNSSIDQVNLCFCLNNMDKTVDDLNIFNYRLELMDEFKKDLEGELGEGIEIDINITNQGRFFDKAEIFQQYLNCNSFYFIMGLDTLVRFVDLKYYKDELELQTKLNSFFKKCQIVLGWRKYDNSTDSCMDHEYLKPYNSKIHLLNLNPDNLQSVSSTSIRNSIRLNDGEWKQWVTPNVIHYIESNQLY